MKAFAEKATRVHGENYMRRVRETVNGPKKLYSNNAWKLPRGIEEEDIAKYTHSIAKMQCSVVDDKPIGWKATMTNREVAK